MVESSATIVNARGMHTRPSAKLAKLAREFSCDVWVGKKGGELKDGKSIVALLTLAAGCNATLTIRAKGKDEKAAVAALLKLIANGFEDDEAVANPEKAEVSPPVAAGKKRPPPARKIGGIGIGNAAVTGRLQIQHNAPEAAVPHWRLGKGQAEAEARRYNAALASVRADFDQLREASAKLPSAAEILPFIDFYKNFLDDKEFAEKPQALIRRRQINAEWALKERVDVVADNFRRIPDSYLRERAGDINYVMRRLLAAMAVSPRRRAANAELAEGKNTILVCADLDPADLIRIHRLGYLGFVTESGSATSHTSILARSLNMPGLVAARGALACARHGARALLDAKAEHLVVNPGAALLRARARPAAAAPRRRRKRAAPAVAKCGERAHLYANIELPDEAEAATAAEGVGLFRSEFLFMQRDELPGEDEQFEVYRAVLARLAPAPVVIRTLDLGGEKMPSAGEAAKEQSSALGVRAIRYCLANPELFTTQLRALLRAGAESGNLQILFPMLSHPDELERALALANSAREQLRLAGKKAAAPRLPPLGGMIEVPAAVFIVPALAKRLDFFSIGTNDLIQYTLAIDRNEETLAPLYDPLHPAVLQLLAKTVAQAQAAGKPVTLCGEMAADPTLTRPALALGLRRLSLNIKDMEAVRERVLQSDCRVLQKMAARLLAAQTPQAARDIAEEINAA